MSPKTRCFLLLLISALVGGASTVHADSGTVYLAVGSDSFAGQPAGFPVDFGGTNPWQYGDGGEFTAFVTGLGLPLSLNPLANGGFDLPAGYSPAALRTNPGTSSGYSAADDSSSYAGYTGFETFCVEANVDFYVGSSYSYTTGFGIQDPSSSITGLTAGVAWLYQQFATGVLAGFNYVNPSARLTDAGQLQSTLWYLQGEGGDPFAPSPTSGNPFYSDAIAQFGSLAAAQATVNNLNSSFGVEVLELSSGQTLAQDQLVYTGSHGVGERTNTWLLLLASLAALPITRRARRASGRC